MEKKKAPGIVVLGVFIILWGIASWLAGLDNPDSGRLAPPDQTGIGLKTFLVSEDFLTNLIFYAVFIWSIIAGIGVLLRKKWGRLFYIVYAVGMFCYGLFFFMGEGKFGWYAVFFLVFLVVGFLFPVWYFMRPSIKKLFT
jgi:hypothetical protein